MLRDELSAEITATFEFLKGNEGKLFESQIRSFANQQTIMMALRRILKQLGGGNEQNSL
jgi:hypothetical protein